MHILMVSRIKNYILESLWECSEFTHRYCHQCFYGCSLLPIRQTTRSYWNRPDALNRLLVCVFLYHLFIYTFKEGFTYFKGLWHRWSSWNGSSISLMFKQGNCTLYRQIQTTAMIHALKILLKALSLFTNTCFWRKIQVLQQLQTRI